MRKGLMTSKFVWKLKWPVLKRANVLRVDDDTVIGRIKNAARCHASAGKSGPLGRSKSNA